MSGVNLNDPNLTIGAALMALGPMLSEIKIEGLNSDGQQKINFFYTDGNRYAKTLPQGQTFMEENGTDLSIYGIKLIMKTMDEKYNSAQREFERSSMRRLLAAHLPDNKYKQFFALLFPEIQTRGSKNNNHLKFINLQ